MEVFGAVGLLEAAVFSFLVYWAATLENRNDKESLNLADNSAVKLYLWAAASYCQEACGRARERPPSHDGHHRHAARLD